jgi:CheY-like chemotaxis protein
MRILIVDDDPSTEVALAAPLAESGVEIDTARDSMTAIEKLSRGPYTAIVITPLIRYALNGFAVLSYIEQEQREMLPRVFVLTVLPKETIKRMAPAVLSRCFQRSEQAALAEALVEFCGRTGAGPPKARVLLAEDNAETARIEGEILHELGYAYRWVSCGSDLLDAVRSTRFDALLLDMVMPDVDGLKMLEALRTTEPDLLRRVVVVTGLPPQYLEEVRGYPVCGILPKPVDAEKLQSLLARCAAG